MDTLLPVLCLLLGIALPVGGAYLAGRRAWRQLAVAEAYRDVATVLGLSVDTRGVSVHGHLTNRRLYVGEVMQGHGTDRRLEHRAILGLERPLGLGLLVRRRASRRWLRRRARAEAVHVEDRAFDNLFEVFGDDSERVNALLTPRVKEAFSTFAQRWPDLLITDHHIRVMLRQPETSAGGLGELVQGMNRIADLLRDARREVEPPKDLERNLEEWLALGDSLGLEVEPWLPALVGQIRGRAVAIALRRENEGHAAEVTVRFDAHRDLGLRLTPQVRPDGYWSVGQDIQLGDEPFDQAFVIKGYDPSAVRRLLDPEIRALLLSLDAEPSHEVDVDDRRIRVRGVANDPAKARAVLNVALRLADATGW